MHLARSEAEPSAVGRTGALQPSPEPLAMERPVIGDAPALLAKADHQLPHPLYNPFPEQLAYASPARKTIPRV